MEASINMRNAIDPLWRSLLHWPRESLVDSCQTVGDWPLVFARWTTRSWCKACFAMNLMTTIWIRWKQGWIVLLKTTWFLIVLSVLASPINFVDVVLGTDDQAVFDNAGFHPKKAIVFAVAVLWVPFAFWLASELTGCLRPSKTGTRRADPA